MNEILRKDINWVGYIDFDVRDFHGYNTKRGSTYNAYLVQDEKNALIDTVKAPFANDLLKNISELIELEKIDYVVCNHAEPDHSSSLSVVMNSCTNAELVCNAKCKDILGKHFNTEGWKFKIVDDGESLSLGSKTLTFLNTPMVHWPESMFTYIPEEKLLFSMDAFGQHYASENRFDDEETLDVVMEEAKTYYANIVMLYGKQISKVLGRSGGLDIEMIAPSHGVIWRKNLDVILSAYTEWVVCKPKAKVIIAYDTMWKSTEIMAKAIADGAKSPGVTIKLLNVRVDSITTLATEVLDAAVLAFGSPTLNMTLMPAMAAALTYLKGLHPTGKAGFAFGSYGWAKSGTKDIEEYLKVMKFEILRDPIQAQFVPTDEILKECKEAGKMLGEKAIEAAKE